MGEQQEPGNPEEYSEEEPGREVLPEPEKRGGLKKGLRWCLTGFFALLSIGTFPSLGAAMLAPVEKWQSFLESFFQKKGKVAVVATLAVLSFVTAPVPDAAKSDDPSATTGASMQSTVASHVDSITVPTRNFPAFTETEIDTTATSWIATETSTEPRQTEFQPTEPKPTEPRPVETGSPMQWEADYILNTNTKKFHFPDCSAVKTMADKNKESFSGSREALIDQGYQPCGRCHP